MKALKMQLPKSKRVRNKNTPLYNTWANMKKRCNGGHAQYGDYGGRGITYDPAWEQYAGFAKDMGPHPGKGWSIDREDNDLGYSKLNCRWATRKTQNRNRRVSTRSGKLTLEKATQIRQSPKSIPVLAAEFGVSRKMIYNIKQGVQWT